MQGVLYCLPSFPSLFVCTTGVLTVCSVLFGTVGPVLIALRTRQKLKPCGQVYALRIHFM